MALGPIGKAILTVLILPAASIAADRPADPLLDLLPPDAGLTLTVEGLRDAATSFLASPTANRLMALPAARAWLESDQFRRLAAARRDIEAGTGLGLLEIRDELLGDAAVLAMYQPSGAPADAARGVLLLRPRDPDRLSRLIDAVNRADARILRNLGSRSHRGVPFTSREFRAGTKPDEWYAVLDGPVLAWSNSEALVRAVIDRHEESSLPNLRRLSAFDRVRRALPERAVAGLYANARFIEGQLASAPEPRKDDERRMASAIRKYAKSVDYAGIALEWADGPRLHLHQEIDPSRIGPSMRAWADRGGSIEGLVRGMPAEPVAILAGNLHLPPMLGALKALMDPRDWSRLELIAQATAGVEPERLWALVGSIGPACALGIEAPDPGKVSWVGSVELGPAIDAESRRIVGGMLRSALALDSLRLESKGEPARIVSEERGGVEITSRVGGRPLAFSMAANRAVLGSSPEAIVRYLNGDVGGGESFRGLRDSRFSGADSFAYVDLGRLRTLLAVRREWAAAWMGRRGPDAARDLDQVLGLLGLFRYAYATARIAPGFTSIDHTLGLVPEASP